MTAPMQTNMVTYNDSAHEENDGCVGKSWLQQLTQRAGSTPETVCAALPLPWPSEAPVSWQQRQLHLPPWAPPCPHRLPLQLLAP